MNQLFERVNFKLTYSFELMYRNLFSGTMLFAAVVHSRESNVLPDYDAMLMISRVSLLYGIFNLAHVLMGENGKKCGILISYRENLS